MDSESMHLNVHIDRAMLGKFYAFKKLSKPQTVLSLFFENVNRPTVINTINFLAASNGNFLTYIDYDGVKWNGAILTNDIHATHVKIHDNQFTLEFEGAIAL